MESDLLPVSNKKIYTRDDIFYGEVGNTPAGVVVFGVTFPLLCMHVYVPDGPRVEGLVSEIAARLDRRTPHRDLAYPNARPEMKPSGLQTFSVIWNVRE